MKFEAVPNIVHGEKGIVYSLLNPHSEHYAQMF